MSLPSASARPGPAWSFTRHHMLAECPRQYWFEYLAASQAPRQERDGLARLRRLVPLGFVRGSFVHDEIGRLLPHLLAGKPVDVTSACEEITRWMDALEDHAEAQVAEHHNGLPVDHALFAEMGIEACEEVRWFVRYTWAAYAALEHVQHENPERFVVSGVPAAVRLDFCGRGPGGGVVIADWKSGRRDSGGESRLQMAAYVLWATQALSVDASRVEARLVYLKTGETVPIRFNAHELAEAERTIAGDWARMSSGAHRDAFEPTPARSKCLPCKYATACDAADLAGARATRAVDGQHGAARGER